MQTAQKILNQVFGYTEFRAEQASIIQHLINGEDAFVLMPTGGGKSLCYQIPAIVREGLGVVISPLIALMKDQVDALLQLGVKAAYLNSSLTEKESAQVLKKILNNELDLLYVAPERLLTPHFLNILKQIPLSLFAIDEAHCVSSWGHDFRPEYIKLSVIHENFPTVPRVALTATADKLTRIEIIEKLALDKARQFISSFDRPNIYYRIMQKQNVKEQLCKLLETEHGGDSGIIYCLSRKKVEEVADFLKGRGFDARPYHAGLSNIVREKNQQHFIREEGSIMVATVAFGMGIDKPNVRFVAHLDLPKSLEGYYQETGRAGRDGLPANAWLAYGLGDVVALRKLFSSKEGGDEQFKRLEGRKLNALLGFCETTICRRQVLLNYFGESYQGPCQNCDNCLCPVETWEGTKAAQMALSCVYRTGQRFGVKHLIDVLSGKRTPQVERFRHHEVSTFGIGTMHSESEWQSIYRQLVAADLLITDMAGYGGLQLSPKSKPILSAQASISFRKEIFSKKSLASKEKKVSRLNGKIQPFLPKGQLWQALKDKRIELAQEQGVPPYIIFHDSSLIDIYEKKPTTLKQFSTIFGVGEKKLERYGAAFIKVITAYST